MCSREALVVYVSDLSGSVTVNEFVFLSMSLQRHITKKPTQE